MVQIGKVNLPKDLITVVSHWIICNVQSAVVVAA